MPQRKFSSEELDYFEAEMRNYKLPWITKVLKKGIVPFLRFGMIPYILIILALGIIYNSTYVPIEGLWLTIKIMGLFLIFGIGGVSLIGHFAELISVNRLRRRLGLTKQEFQSLVSIFQVTGM